MLTKDENSVLTEHVFIPYHSSPLPDGPWLVFAPHPDDETFGMGGTLLLAQQHNIPVTLLVVTNGSQQGEGGNGDLVTVRENEAREAARRLGIAQIFFWNQEDRGLQLTEELVKRVVMCIQQEQPQSIFFPSPMEFHPDHRTTAALVWEGIKQCSEFSGTAISYEISSQSQINILIDITLTAEDKFTLLKVYQSQLGANNYQDVIKALNITRTYTLPKDVRYAEGFFVYPGDFSQEPIAHMLANFCSPPYKASADSLPLVSVMIRSKDRPALLREALESVINQTYSHLELVVINDGDKDVSILVNRFKHHVSHLHYIPLERNTGRAAAANYALDAARGEFLIFLDADNLFARQHITTLVNALQLHPDYQAAYTAVRGKEGREDILFTTPYDQDLLFRENYIPIHALLFKRELITAGCHFDEHLELFENWDFWLQLSQFTDFLYIPQQSVTFRALGDSGISDHDTVSKARTLIRQKWKPLQHEICQKTTIKRIIRHSGLFEKSFYVKTNPDVARAGDDPLEHFIVYGGKEGRNPGPQFDSSFYLTQYPDVAQAGLNPLVHYLVYGRDEGRSPLPPKVENVRGIHQQDSSERPPARRPGVLTLPDAHTYQTRFPNPNYKPQTHLERVWKWQADNNDEKLRGHYDFLNQSSLILDLGGFAGEYAFYMHQKYGVTCHVFEVVQRFCERIQADPRCNKKICVHPFGLAGSTRQERLFLADQGSSIFYNRSNSDSAESITIELVRASDWFKQNIPNRMVDLMKINIEGGEYELLEHLLDESLITQIRNIQVQFHEDVIADAAQRMVDIHARLTMTHRLTFQERFVWENWELVS